MQNPKRQGRVHDVLHEDIVEPCRRALTVLPIHPSLQLERTAKPLLSSDRLTVYRKASCLQLQRLQIDRSSLAAEQTS